MENKKEKPLSPKELEELKTLEKELFKNDRLKPLSQKELEELEALEKEFGGSENPKPDQDEGIVGDLKELGSDIVDGAVAVGEFVDTYTGAPARAAIGAAQNTENPFTAFADQFGEDPSKAPTGKEIAQKAGVSDASLSDLFPNLYTTDDKEAEDWLKFKKGGAGDISTSGFVGLLGDMAIDPLALLGPALKGISKGAKLLRGGNKVIGPMPKNPSMIKNTTEAVAENIDEAKGILGQYLRPKRSKNYPRLKEIAQGNNIDPNSLPHSVEFGKNSFPSRIQRFKAEGPLGEPILNQMDDALRNIDHALENNIVRIGRQKPKGYAYGGNLLREGYDKAVDKFYKNIDITYGNIHKLNPGLPLSEGGFKKLSSKLNGLEKWAKGKILRGIPGEGLEEARHLQKVIEAVKNGNGSVKQVVEAMQDIGELAFKSQNYLDKTPKNIKKLKELYFTMSDSIIDSVKTGLGDEMAEALIENNKRFNEFFGDSSFLKQIGNKNIDAQDLFRSVVKKGDLNQINSLKKILDEDTLQGLKSEYLHSLISRNADGHINFRKLRNALSDENTKALKLFDAGELDNIKDLIELHDSLGSKVLSSSGTGASNSFLDFIQHPLKNMGATSAGDALSKNYIQRARGEIGPGPVIKTIEGAGDIAKGTGKVVKTSAKKVKEIATDKKIQRIAIASPVIAKTFSTQDKEKTLRGRNKWALDGLYKLTESYPDRFNERALLKIFKDKEGKKLLIEASGVGENSKRFNNLIQKLDKISKDRD